MIKLLGVPQISEAATQLNSFEQILFKANCPPPPVDLHLMNAIIVDETTGGMLSQSYHRIQSKRTEILQFCQAQAQIAADVEDEADYHPESDEIEILCLLLDFCHYETGERNSAIKRLMKKKACSLERLDISLRSRPSPNCRQSFEVSMELIFQMKVCPSAELLARRADLELSMSPSELSDLYETSVFKFCVFELISTYTEEGCNISFVEKKSMIPKLSRPSSVSY